MADAVPRCPSTAGVWTGSGDTDIEPDPDDGLYRWTTHALKPVEVTEAEADGRHVLRQGDMFGVPTDLTTRHVRRLGVHTRRGAPAPDGQGVSRNQLHRTAHRN